MKDTVTTETQLAAQVNEAVKALLPGRLREKVAKEKRFHDSVWGTIVLRPHEVALIDTPLFQRLRRIRQLGSSHLVFPGAMHTRFEHTLGVAHLAGRMAEKLAGSNNTNVTKDDIDNLRMAALCHDLGHGPFSHYSERFFETMPPFGNKPDGPSTLSAAEQLSKMIVESDAMGSAFAQINETYDDVNLDPGFIADVITGDLDDDRFFLGEIVHGPFDADKLDYLTRDGLHCGIPVNVDSERIFALMGVAADGNGKTRLVGKKQAANTLANLVHHKHFMYAAVYQHEVSRSFKCMCVNAFRCAVDDETKINGTVIRSPADFLSLDDEMVLAPGVVEKGSRAAGIFSAMRERRLFKVAAEMKGIAKKKNHKRQRDLAKKAGVPPDQVAIDPAMPVNNTEAMNMLIKTDEGLFTLKELMNLRTKGTPLHDRFERDLVFCPKDSVAAVGAAAKELLQQAP